MANRVGGMTVKNGFYWNVAKWEMRIIPRQGGILPGDAGDRYLKVPILALLVVAPLMGALYAVFLPFIGFALVLGFAARKAGAGAKTLVGHVMATVSPQWRPGEAYLAGKGKPPAAKGPDADAEPKPGAAQPLDAIEREIEDQRKLNG